MSRRRQAKKGKPRPGSPRGQSARRKPIAPNGHRHHRATPRGRALDALTYMRREKSLTRAAKLAGTTPRTIKRYLLPLIERDRSGRWIAPRSDTVTRRLYVPTPDGTVRLPIRSFLSASRLGRYWNAVDAFLRGRGMAALREFRGKAIRVGKIAYPFITDPRTLRRLAYAGEVRFEDLYGETR
jgi:hypothetical protein